MRLLLTAEREALERLARLADVAALDGAAPAPGSVAVVLRRSAAGFGAADPAGAVRHAAAMGIPVLVVAGIRDREGEALAREARLAGVPAECVLFVEGGSVVDAAGKVRGPALRGSGVGLRLVEELARDALQKGLVPEPALWEPPEDAPVWAPDAGIEAAPEPEPAAGEALRPAEPAPAGPPPARPGALASALDRASAVAAVFSAKGGVGATTLAACLAGLLEEDYGAVHLEVSPAPAGYVYRGATPAEAAASGAYAYTDGRELVGEVPPGALVVADVSLPEAMDEVYARAGCVVMVADGSRISLENVRSWLAAGWRLDVLVVSRHVPGSGYPPEVYASETGVSRVVGVPGGVDEEAAVNLAQHEGRLPFGRSVDLDAALNEIAAAVLDALDLKPKGA